MNLQIKRCAETSVSLPKILSAAILIFIVSISLGQTPSNGINAKNGLAIKGYDPVGYFSEGKPVKGDTSFTSFWQGGKWLFSSQKNLDAFTTNPEKYAPQYGGYCAYGASRGYKADTDPVAFTIVGDKLFLNYNIKVKEEWLKDTARRIQLANEYWKTLQ